MPNRDGNGPYNNDVQSRGYGNRQPSIRNRRRTPYRGINMNNNLYAFYEKESKNVYIEKVDKSKCKSKNLNVLPQNECYNIIYKGEKAGIITFGKSTRYDHIAFCHVLIFNKFKLLSLARIVRYMFAKKYGIKKLYVTVNANNTSAVRACEKFNCIRLRDKKQEYLRNRGLLGKDQIRYLELYNFGG